MSDEIKILDGNTFVVSDASGDIEASATDPTGLFSFDTRYLAKWVLTINGERLTALSTDDLQYFETRFFLIPGASAVYQNSKQSVIRTRAVADGFHERITVLNHDDKPVDLTIRIEAANDFADLFEVKDALEKKGMYGAQVKGKSLMLGYRRETYARATVITATGPAKFDRKGLTFKVRVEPQGEWSTDVQVTIPLLGEVGGKSRRGKRDLSVGLDRWVRDAPRLECDWEPLRNTYRRSLVDLAALRFSPMIGRPEQPAGRRAALVHDHVRARQHLHEPPGAAVCAGAGGNNVARARLPAGNSDRRLPRRGSRTDPARDALRRADGVRGASALAVLRLGRCDAAVCRAARRVRALDRRPEARARLRGRGSSGAPLDRRVRRPPGQRVHRVPAAERGDRPREPVLEGLLGFALVPGRAAAGVPPGDLRAPGICV